MKNEFILMKMPVEDIGRALSYSDDFDQSAVLNSWAKELKIICGSHLDMQLCSMTSHLNPDAVDMINLIAEFARARELAK